MGRAATKHATVVVCTYLVRQRHGFRTGGLVHFALHHATQGERQHGVHRSHHNGGGNSQDLEQDTRQELAVSGHVRGSKGTCLEARNGLGCTTNT